MHKYFLFFRINTTTNEGRALVKIMDLKDYQINHEHYRGFNTKSSMLKWISEYANAIREYQMLKPID